MESKQIELLNRKNSFENWLKERKDLHAGGSESHLEFLKDKGFLVFEEDSADKVRLEASIFLTRKKDFELSDTRFFYNCVYLLLSYAEYLEELEKIESSLPVPEKTEKNEADKKRDLLLVVCYLSCRDDALRKLHYDSPQSAFEDIAEKFGCKCQAVKDIKFEFDTFFGMGGKSDFWYKNGLGKDGREVSDFCTNISFNEFDALIKEVFKEYGWKEEEEFLGLSKKKEMSALERSIYDPFHNCR